MRTQDPSDTQSEVVQEYVHSAGQTLRVDAGRGLLRGVKLLGLRSRNGRRYEENALRQAVGLYEGAKVNVNHPERDPLAPRDYRDRLGVVRNVQLNPGEGLFGDLHFNPSHPLAEQLSWDAENAPENVGLSHNVLAKTRSGQSGVVVEAITRVRSVDLVADPATTNGLFEQQTGDSFTAESLPTEIQKLREQLAHAEERAQRESQRRRIEELLRQYEVESDLDSVVFSEAFVRQAMAATNDELPRVVLERVEQVRADCEASRPRSREQSLASKPAELCESTHDFVSALTRRA